MIERCALKRRRAITRYKGELRYYFIVSTPQALAGGDGTFQYFAKLGGLKNFEYTWGGWLSWGGSKIPGGDEPLFMQNKIL